MRNFFSKQAAGRVPLQRHSNGHSNGHTKQAPAREVRGLLMYSGKTCSTTIILHVLCLCQTLLFQCNFVVFHDTNFFRFLCLCQVCVSCLPASSSSVTWYRSANSMARDSVMSCLPLSYLFICCCVVPIAIDTWVCVSPAFFLHSFSAYCIMIQLTFLCIT